MNSKLAIYLGKQKQRKTLLYEGKSFFRNMRKLGVPKAQAQEYKNEVNEAIRRRRAENFEPSLKTRTWDTRYGRYGQKFGKELLVRSSPEVVRYMDVNSGDYGYMTPTVRRQLKQIMEGTVPKKRIISEINRELTDKSISDEWKEQLKGLKEDLEQTTQPGLTALKWQPTTDWYEEHKQELRDMSVAYKKMKSEKGTFAKEDVNILKETQESVDNAWFEGVQGVNVKNKYIRAKTAYSQFTEAQKSDISKDPKAVIRALEKM